MTIEQANLVAEAVSDEGCDVEVQEDYSGRGMYGKSVPALVVDSSCVVLVGWAFGKLGLSASDIPHRTDSMGRDGVVLY